MRSPVWALLFADSLSFFQGCQKWHFKPRLLLSSKRKWRNFLLWNRRSVSEKIVRRKLRVGKKLSNVLSPCPAKVPKNQLLPTLLIQRWRFWGKLKGWTGAKREKSVRVESGNNRAQNFKGRFVKWNRHKRRVSESQNLGKMLKINFCFRELMLLEAQLEEIHLELDSNREECYGHMKVIQQLKAGKVLKVTKFRNTVSWHDFCVQEKRKSLSKSSSFKSEKEMKFQLDLVQSKRDLNFERESKTELQRKYDGFLTEYESLKEDFRFFLSKYEQLLSRKVPYYTWKSCFTVWNVRNVSPVILATEEWVKLARFD